MNVRAERIRLVHIMFTAICITVKNRSRGWDSHDMSCFVLDIFGPVQCCFIGQVYRDAVRIHNRGSAAMKATLSLPHAVQPFLQAQPIAGFCQVCALELQVLV